MVGETSRPLHSFRRPLRLLQTLSKSCRSLQRSVLALPYSSQNDFPPGPLIRMVIQTYVDKPLVTLADVFPSYR